jgi:hypothetical protein
MAQSYRHTAQGLRHMAQGFRLKAEKECCEAINIKSGIYKIFLT